MVSISRGIVRNTPADVTQPEVQSVGRALEAIGEALRSGRGGDQQGGRALMSGQGAAVAELLANRCPTSSPKLAHQAVNQAHEDLLGWRPTENVGHWHRGAEKMLAEGKSLDEVTRWVRDSIKLSDEYCARHPEALAARKEWFAPAVRSSPSSPSSPSSGPLPQGFSPVTAEDVKNIMPGAADADVETYLGPLNEAMAEGGITTPRRQAAFLAQVAVESGQLKYKEEIASGAAYEGRGDLGNSVAGDGTRFKGRGLIQLTGRANYRSTGEALGLDLESNPALAMDPKNSVRIAAHYFNSRGLNEIADGGDIDTVSRRVNGGDNGLAERRAYYSSALAVLEQPGRASAMGAGAGASSAGAGASSAGASPAGLKPAEQAFLSQAPDWTNCGPTSMTMALAQWGMGNADEATARRLKIETGTQAAGQFPGGPAKIASELAARGLSTSASASTDIGALQRDLEAGRTAVVNGQTLSSRSAHFIYVAGYDRATNTFTVNDPASGGTAQWTPAMMQQFMSRSDGGPTGYAAVWR